MAVTIKDVAERAGVHSSTVSRVFAGHQTISQATRERVLAAAVELNFHPNAIAGALRTQRVSALGMVIPYRHEEFFLDPFFPEVVRGISTMICPKGYRLTLSGVEKSGDEPEAVMRLVRSHVVDGIIVQASRVGVDTTSLLREEGHPFVLLGRPLHDHQDINWVEIDALNGTREAVAHLLGLGHRCIAFIGGQAELVVTLDRLQGYRAALVTAGVSVDDRLVDYGDFT
jgi:DNA-binding LacI/PurR family transcriptional regulator